MHWHSITWGSVADFLSAGGTIFAATTALYLAGRQFRVKLLAHLMYTGDEVYCELINLSRQQVLVTRVELIIGRFARSPQHAVDIVFVGGESFPVFIHAGGSIMRRSLVVGGSSSLPGRLISARGERMPWNRQVYLSVTLGNGSTVYSRVNREVLRKMLGFYRVVASIPKT